MINDSAPRLTGTITIDADLAHQLSIALIRLEFADSFSRVGARQLSNRLLNAQVAALESGQAHQADRTKEADER